MQIVSFTPEFIVLALGSFISLLFKFFPVLNTWYAAKRTELKSAIMIGLMLLITGVITLLSHYGIIAMEEPVTVQRFVMTLFFAISSNQFTYMIVPAPIKVTIAKETSDERPVFNT